MCECSLHPHVWAQWIVLRTIYHEKGRRSTKWTSPRYDDSFPTYHLPLFLNRDLVTKTAIVYDSHHFCIIQWALEAFVMFLPFYLSSISILSEGKSFATPSTLEVADKCSYTSIRGGKSSIKQTSCLCTVPWMGWDLAQISEASFRHMTRHNGRGVALWQVQFPMILLWGPVLMVLRYPRVSLLPHPALHQHPDPRGHAGISVNAAVCGRSFDVSEAQHLWVHQVSRAKVLIVAVAGGVAWQSVATWVAWVFITRLVKREKKRRRQKYSKSDKVKQQMQIILIVLLTCLVHRVEGEGYPWWGPWYCKASWQ